jgi:hypothetical protein
MTRRLLTALSLVAATIALTADGSPQHTRPRSLPIVEIDPGPFDRTETIVNFALPPTVTGDSLLLRSEDDRVTIPLQISRDRDASFIARNLKAGVITRYRLEPAFDRRDTIFDADTSEDRSGIQVRVWEQAVIRYHTDNYPLLGPEIKPAFKRAGYLHPVRTPTGRIITDDYLPNDYHHHGIWTAWAKTIFQNRTPDFWNLGDGTGTVEFEALLDRWSGRVHARHRFVDLSAPTPTTVMTEVWELTLYAAGQGRQPYRLFDLVSTQEMVALTPLTLPEFRFGGLGFHGPRTWNGANNTQFLTSEGKTRSNALGTRARWCYIGGQVDGAQAGLAILGHPTNLRAPQPMRIHPDSPFFAWAPTQLGEMQIIPGHPYTSRYRFVVFDGPPDATLLDRLWQDYANPVKAHIAS